MNLIINIIFFKLLFTKASASKAIGCNNSIKVHVYLKLH